MFSTKNYPQDAVFGSIDEAGIGMDDLYIHQGAERIGFITEHLQESSLSGELLHTSIELGKIELGVGRNIFQLDYKKFHPLLMDCWIKDVWKFGDEQNILIEDKVIDNMQLQRQGDVFIMEEIIHSQHFTTSQLEKINRCRLHIQATTWADITNGYGTRISTSARQGKRDTTRTSEYNFPVQPQPGVASIRLWRSAIQKCFLLLYHTTLRPELRCWTIPVNPRHTWFYLPSHQQLFQKLNDHRYRIWKRISRSGNIGQYPKFERHSNTMIIPKRCVRATIEKVDGNKFRLSGWYKEETEAHCDTTRSLMIDDDYLSDLDIINTQTLQHIGQSIQEGSLKVVSDGSYLDTHKLETASWILETPNGVSTSGRITIPGNEEVQGSYRSKLGLYGGLSHVALMCKLLNITEGHITLGCDGLGAVQIIGKKSR